MNIHPDDPKWTAYVLGELSDAECARLVRGPRIEPADAHHRVAQLGRDSQRVVGDPEAVSVGVADLDEPYSE